MQLNRINSLLLRLIKEYFVILTNQFLIFEIKKYKIDDVKPIEKYSNEIGIVIQGPLNKQNNFSLQTIKFLKRKYPNVFMVLSTWEGEDEESLLILKELGVKCIKSKLPKNIGIKNINLQIFSSKVGLEFLKKSGCKYALKMRTDQSLNESNDFIGFFLNILTQFYHKNLNEYPLNKKLIISSLNTFKNRYYGVSDMLMFGEIEDMEKYWTPKFDTKKLSDIVVENDNHFFMRQETAEGYLICEFMKAVSHEPKWTEEDHRSFMAKFFVLIDHCSVGHFWFKNKWWMRNNSSNEYLSFGDWLNMYNEVNKEYNRKTL